MSGPPPYPFMPRPGMPPLPGPGMPAPGMMAFPPGPRSYPIGGPPPGMFPGHPPMHRPSAVMRPPFLSTMARPPPVLPKPAMPAPVVPKSTTVYVGKIAPSVGDDFLKILLEACGEMKSWKRVLDPETNQPKGFGFCEFVEADGVLRSMRLLNNFSLDNQQLLLKPNSATDNYVKEYQARKEQEKRMKAAKKVDEKEKDKEQGELVAEETDEQVDNRVLEKIMGLVSDREEKLSKEKTDKERANDLLNSLEKQSEKRDLPLPPPPLRDRPVEHRSVDHHRAADHRSTDHRAADHRAADHRADHDRERELEREFERERERERKEEDSKRRESDRAYESKVRDWEKSERELLKARDREREKLKESEREHAKAVRADLEVPEADDDLEPWMRKSYRSSRRAEERRKRRYREEQEDAVDREREAVEVEEERERKRQEGGGEGGDMETDFQADANGGMGAEVKEEVKEEVKAEPVFDTNDAIYQAMIAAAKAPPPVKHPSPHPAAAPASPFHDPTSTHRASPLQPHTQPHTHTHTTPPPEPSSSSQDAKRGAPAVPVVGSGRMESPLNGVPGGSAAVARKNPNLQALFGEEEEEGSKRRKLVPLKYTAEELRAVQQPASTDDPKEVLRKMMDSIPTNRQGVFNYHIKWDAYNDQSISARVTKWVSKKINELLGMEMPDVVVFIMELLNKHTAPQSTFDELVSIIDSEAETFVIKLYRMVIYETEKAALVL